jgi:thiol-disulfide isomerase/thioredoxin
MRRFLAQYALSLCLSFPFPLSFGASPCAQAPSDKIGVRLRGVDGKTYDIGVMGGSVLVISFGATWCLPCKAELAALEDLKREYAGKPVRFLWVSIEGENDITDKQLKAYAKEQKSTLLLLRDPSRATYEQFASRIPSPLKQSVKTPVPLVVFIDATGHFSPPGHFGMTSADSYKAAVRARLDKLLSSRKAENAAGAR